MPPKKAKKTAKKAAKKAAKKPAGAKAKPCNCKADKFLTDKFINFSPPTPPPHIPPLPMNPGRKKYWMDNVYESYWDLYAAVVRLELMVAANAGAWPDAAPADRLSDPTGGKPGCPPPPPFP